MRAQVGDEIVIESQALGRPPRRGRVQEILGSADTEHFRVRWDDGHESVYFPGADGHVVHPVPGVPVQSPATSGAPAGSVATVSVAADRIEGHESLRTAAQLLTRSAVGALVVQDPGSPPALLTQLDVLAALGKGADPDVVWVADVASTTTVWVARDDELARAAESMRDARVTHALVRDGLGMSGVAGLTDVLGALVDAAQYSSLTG